MASLVPQEHAAVLDRVCGLAASFVGPTDPPGLIDFIRVLYADVSIDDLLARNVEDLAAAARSMWRYGFQREPGVTLVRAYNPQPSPDGWASSHTVVEVISDDMPFIVDSITMEFDRRRCTLQFSSHPIVAVDRTETKITGVRQIELAGAIESFVHVEIERIGDESELRAIEAGLRVVLADVRAATQDWIKMVASLRAVANDLARRPPRIPVNEVVETRDVLDWMANHHFTLLGTCEYLAQDGAFVPIAESALGLMHDPQRHEFPNDGTEELLTICKDPERSRIHRDTYLDAVTVRRYADDGSVIGAWRCIGLWTSAAYNASPVDIPMVRHKVQAIVQRAGFPPTSHSGKDLIAILESYPRDELFQISEDELFATASGIMQLNERRRVRVFARRDNAGQFATALVFVPRDRYTTTVRERIDALLTRAFAATGSEWSVRVSENALARVQFVLRLDPARLATPDIERIEAEIRSAIRSWPDELAVTLCDTYGEVHGNALARRYCEAFPAAYRDDVSVAEAATDIASLEQMRERDGIVVRFRPADDVVADDASAELIFTIFAHREIALSEAMPILGNLGVDVVDEHPYRCTIDTTATWIERFRVRVALPDSTDRNEQLRGFEAAFTAVLAGRCDNDLFGTLVLGAQLNWREAALLRTYARYMRQVGTPFSHDYIAIALARNPSIARALVERFHQRFDPDRSRPSDAALDEPDAIDGMLDHVPSLDDDRILRTYRNLIDATLRTNWYQSDEAGTSRPTVALKFAPTLIADMPKPVPAFEIFVDSPQVEGVHLRMGEFARGGLRWSDRREDFRTEVLGLVKAQSVKNAVIVPVGAKGGFVPKQLPLPAADRDAWMAEGVAAYSAFVGALLDVTDNLIDGVVAHPNRTVRYDGDDHYLVVAADKGTATFSDIANQIAVDRGFWLGDAFASGGSAGYDHKAMGITARGAWESVQAHFRTFGVDTQTQDFTVAGIGDMSGDVFGNGMLLSTHIQLVAAFDHRHIFLDPTPDAAASFAERQRLFALPRSSWADYDAALLSPGGGIFERTLKSIPITPEVALALGLDADVHALAPNALVNAILRAPVDLLWNGGIGTYIKATSERHADVGDKANDSLRADASALRCKVIGEGGNLGCTQLGRIEYALGGGHINTDAIDNSAGVDTSDHEVNIKILVDRLVAESALALEDRNALLASLTDAIAEQVLQDNYDQNRALLIAASQSNALAAVHERWIGDLVGRARLDRELEYLPATEDLKSRAANHGGLTSPEFSVMLAYTKADLTDALRQSEIIQDPEWTSVLLSYFPDQLQQQAHNEIMAHPLRNEIVATTLSNAVVNTAGTTMLYRLHTETGLPYPVLVSAYRCVWRIFDQQQLWDEIADLDNRVTVETQVSMYLESRKLVERATRWIARSRWSTSNARATIDFFAAGVERCAHILPKLLRGNEQTWIINHTKDLIANGCPAELAGRVAQLDSLVAALDIVEGAHTCQRTVDDVAAVRAVVGDRMQFDWLLDRISDDLPRADQWDALARDALRDDAAREYRAITTNVLAVAQGGDTADTAFDRWALVHADQVVRVRQIFDEVSSHGVFDLATLSVATRALRSLSTGS